MVNTWGQHILEGNVVNDDILNEIENPGNGLHNEDENLNVNNEVSMFLMILREIHKTPQAASSFVANEFIDLLKMWRENMEKDVYAVLQRAGVNNENLGQFGLKEVFQESELEQACNLFSTTRNLQKYVAEQYAFVEPCECTLGRDNASGKEHTMQYVPILATLRALLKFDDVLGEVPGGHVNQSAENLRISVMVPILKTMLTMFCFQMNQQVFKSSSTMMTSQ